MAKLNPLGIRKGSIIRALHRHFGDDANLTMTVSWVRVSSGVVAGYWNADGDVTEAVIRITPMSRICWRKSQRTISFQSK